MEREREREREREEKNIYASFILRQTSLNKNGIDYYFYSYFFFKYLWSATELDSLTINYISKIKIKNWKN